MPELLVQTEAVYRLAIFAGLFGLLAVIEGLHPRRPLQLDRLGRWPANLMLLLLDGLAVRLLFPLGAAGVALAFEQSNTGLLNNLEVPDFMAALLTLLALDLVIYAQHRLFHTVPFFWRFHGVHHSDGDMDLTTGIRFHPVEILLSMLLKLAAIAALGAPPEAVLGYEIALSAMSLFVHSNVGLPERLDKALRKLIVTPDMHRIHHSHITTEHNSNYGTVLVFWDHLFGSYTENPQLGHQGMRIGLPGLRPLEQQRIDRMLLWPWQEGRRRNNR